MRVLITTIELPENIEQIRGGVHSALINLLHGFVHTGSVIRVLSFHKNEPTIKHVQFSDQIEIIHLKEGPFKLHLLNFLFFGPSILKDHIRAFNPEVVHFQEGNSFLFVKCWGTLRKPMVLTIHGMSKHEAKRKKKWKDKLTWTVNAWIHALLLPKNLIHLSNFSFALSSHPKNGNEIIIPNAVTPRFFDIQTKTTFNNRLLYVGIIDNNKNIRLTLRLMHALKQKGIIYHLDVMGGFSDQAFENSIKNNIIEWGLEKQVHFHGWVNQSQIIDQLSISDILVVSSFHESLPMVIAEARASGKVVLAVRVGGIPEMIRDGIDGFLFDHGNEELAIEKLKYLSQHPHHAIEMANKAKQHATEHLHSSIIAQKTLEFYRTILS